MTFTQIRHATSIIEFSGTRFIVDPILYKKNTFEPVEGGINEKNPLVDIVVPDDILKNIDVILLTHVHKDHFDPSILDFFGKNMPIVCKKEYEKQLSDLGFCNVNAIDDYLTLRNIDIHVVQGAHGTGAVGALMGNSYGFVLQGHNNETMYITGDTIWCDNVENTLKQYLPTYVVAFAGSAMINNQHITMDEEDIRKIWDQSPNAKVIAVHMNAWNHCRLTRSDLKNAIVHTQLYIPEDGETIELYA